MLQTKNRRMLVIIMALIFACFTVLFCMGLKYGLPLNKFIQYSLPFTSSELNFLEDKGNLKYGLDKNAPPLSFVSGTANQAEGLIVDYISLLSIELEIPCYYNFGNIDQIMRDIGKERIDLSDLFYSESRAKRFDFTQPIYILRSIAVVSSDELESNTIDELKTKKVAAVNGDFVVEYMQNNYPDYQIVLIEDIKEGIHLLSIGEVSTLVGDEAVIDYELNRGEELVGIRKLKNSLYEEEVYFAVKKGNGELLNILNKAILRLKKKDVLEQSQQKWFGGLRPLLKNSYIYEVLAWLAVVCILGGAIIFIWNSIMQEQITLKTNEVQQNQKNLDAIINSLHIYLFVIEQKSGEILLCNDAAVKFLQVKRGEILKYSIDKFPIVAYLYCKEEYISGYEWEGRYYSIVKKKFFFENEADLFAIEDISERIQTEKNLYQNEKMIAVGQLYTGLAHEIRNPLGLIKNYMYIIERYMNDDMGNNAVHVIENSVSRINCLIENLLNFSKSKNQSVEKIMINKLLEEIVEIEQKKIYDLNVKIKIECEDNVFVYSNSEAIKSILFNLINNAIDAYQGNVKNEEHQIRVSVRKEKKSIQLIVEDNAYGMSKIQLEQIFNPFYTTKNLGTGMGLYMVNQQLAKINGNIKVESKLRIGTKFEVMIPNIGLSNSITELEV